MSTLGNKKLELFDMGAGGSEPTADENVQLASGGRSSLLQPDFLLATEDNR